jgi:hypothetical protein
MSEMGDVRSERAQLVLQPFNIDNRFLHLNSPCKTGTPGASNLTNLGMLQPTS